MNPAIREFELLLGEGGVLVDGDLKSGYEVDWTGRYRGAALAVVRPATTAEVAAIVGICRDRDIAIVPQAGNTGLVGGGVPRPETIDEPGSVPRRRSIVLSTQRLTRAGVADADAMQVTLEAGTTLTGWREAARAAGLDAPVDFAARDTATIGGAIATNAGGSRVVRFGTMRQQVVGIEAVLADGSTVGSLSGLPKEAAGLHWPSLLTGSEGTLGIVTAARLRLVPWFRQTATAMVATETIEAAVALLSRLRTTVASLDSVEVIQPAALALVSEHVGARPPVEVPLGGSVVVVDCAAHADPADELIEVLAGAGGIVDTAVATEAGARSALVGFRDRITEAIAVASTAIGVPTFKLDVAVPVAALDELLDVAERAAHHDGCRLIPFGHLAEGNLHLNHLGANDPERLASTVLGAVAQLGGTISAEHGIGIAKAPWLPLIRSDADMNAQRAIKSALDPTRVFNPGVLGR